MKKNIKLQLLESIGKIFEESKDCKLEDSFFEKVNQELIFLSEYFGTTKSQAFFISIVFSLNYKGNTVDLSKLIEYFDCNPMKILVYSDDFNDLHNKGIFGKEKSIHRVKLEGANDQFTINGRVSEAILQSEPMPKIEKPKIKNIIDVLESLYELSEERNNEKLRTFELFSKAKQLIKNNLHFELLRKIDDLKLDHHDRYFFIYLIWKTITGWELVSVNDAVETIYDNSASRFNYLQKIVTGESSLIKNNFIEVVESRFLNDSEVKLSDISVSLLEECEIKLFQNKKRSENIISPSSIPFKELFFSPLEMEQLYLLKNLMKDEAFQETQKRLEEKHLPKGLTVLLHGAPGTGKTEIAKQIAKETDREIMKVEISQSKSMWYGESEKVIKRIFTNYNSFCKKCDRTPILLFNEADAIISKRKDIGNSNVDQTENAIQNIILEELENFEGILIATTNLAKNLDAAFERRFLFKIPFQKPNLEIRANIWQSKMPLLGLEDCRILAGKFDFSGGQIDNISRKKEIHEIIHGEKISLEKLITFCEEETLESNRSKIGFDASR